MPIHDWSKVGAGIFHHFHNLWNGEICTALNGGILPKGYYALVEQFIGNMGPDVLALETPRDVGEATGVGSDGGGTATATETATALAVAVAPPKVKFTMVDESTEYVRKQKLLAVRHSSDDRIVALVEVVSPGNKASVHALGKFVEKAAEAISRGYHLLVLDLFPPSPRDPAGIHGAIWSELTGDAFEPPADKYLTLASYDAGPPTMAYVEPVAVGDAMPEMPLFLEPGEYVPVPLEATYQAAWRGVPRRWRDVLEPPLL
jgi:hypothetical protein